MICNGLRYYTKVYNQDIEVIYIEGIYLDSFEPNVADVPNDQRVVRSFLTQPYLFSFV